MDCCMGFTMIHKRTLIYFYIIQPNIKLITRLTYSSIFSICVSCNIVNIRIPDAMLGTRKWPCMHTIVADHLCEWHLFIIDYGNFTRSQTERIAECGIHMSSYTQCYGVLTVLLLVCSYAESGRITTDVCRFSATFFWFHFCNFYEVHNRLLLLGKQIELKHRIAGLDRIQSAEAHLNGMMVHKHIQIHMHGYGYDYCYWSHRSKNYILEQIFQLNERMEWRSRDRCGTDCLSRKLLSISLCTLQWIIAGIWFPVIVLLLCC